MADIESNDLPVDQSAVASLLKQMQRREDEVEERVVAEIRIRRDKGRAKYGVSMERGDLTRRQWLQHAKEEALDLAIYLEKLIKLEEEKHGT